jgi:hypothetical protein
MPAGIKPAMVVALVRALMAAKWTPAVEDDFPSQPARPGSSPPVRVPCLPAERENHLQGIAIGAAHLLGGHTVQQALAADRRQSNVELLMRVGVAPGLAEQFGHLLYSRLVCSAGIIQVAGPAGTEGEHQLSSYRSSSLGVTNRGHRLRERGHPDKDNERDVIAI